MGPLPNGRTLWLKKTGGYSPSGMILQLGPFFGGGAVTCHLLTKASWEAACQRILCFCGGMECRWIALGFSKKNKKAGGKKNATVKISSKLLICEYADMLICYIIIILYVRLLVCLYIFNFSKAKVHVPIGFGIPDIICMNNS